MFISKTETFLEPIDVKISTNFDADINNKGPKLKVGDHVRISKYKNKILHNFAPQTGQKTFSLLKRLEILYCE